MQRTPLNLVSVGVFAFTLLSCHGIALAGGIGTVERAPEADVLLLEKLDRAIAARQADNVAVILEDLLRRSRGSLKNLVVATRQKDQNEEIDREIYFRGFRSQVLSRLELLPIRYRKLIEQGQEAAVRGLIKSKGGAALTRSVLLEIVESYPLSSQAFDAAEQLAQLAFEEDDLVAALHYDKFVRRLHRTKKVGWAGQVRRILVASRLGQKKRARSSLRIFAKKVKATGRSDLLQLLARTETAITAIEALAQPDRVVQLKLPRRVHPYNSKESERLFFAKIEKPKRINGRSQMPQSGAYPAACLPLVRGDSVMINNGQQVRVWDSRTGKMSAVLPVGLDTELPRFPLRGQNTEIVECGSLILAHLLVNQSSPLLSPQRSPQPISSSRLFGSLFIFDTSRQNRTVYWEGDRGPTGRSRYIQANNLQLTSRRSVKEVLSRGQIVGRPAVCGRRIYTTLVVHDSEAEVWMAAFDRQPREGGDLGVGLKLAWLTMITSNTVQDVRSGYRVFPKVFLSQDQVYCQNGNNTLAALSALDGTLNWVVHSSIPEPEVPTNRFSRVRRNVPFNVTEPLRFISRGSLPDLVLFSPPGEHQIYAYDSQSGQLVWATTRSQYKARSFVVTDDGVVIRYGYRTLVAIDGRSGKLCSYPVSREDTRNYNFLPSSDNVFYSGDYHNGVLALPVGKGWARIVGINAEYDENGRNPIISFNVGPRVKLIGTFAEGHLRMTPTGFAYATENEMWIYGPKSEAERSGKRDALGDIDKKEEKPAKKTE